MISIFACLYLHVTRGVFASDRMLFFSFFLSVPLVRDELASAGRYYGCGGRLSDLRQRTTLPTGGMAVLPAPDLPVGAAQLYRQRDLNLVVWPISNWR